MASRSQSAAEAPRQQREPGTSRSVLSTIASALFFGGCLLICGLCAGGLYFFQPDVRDDPAAVGPLMAEMLDISIPAQFEPRGVIEWNWAFAMSMRGAYYEMPDAESEGMLMFLEVQSHWGTDDPGVEAHIRQALREKGGGVRELELVEETTEQYQVGDETVAFTLETRRDAVTDQTYRVIDGVVEGKSGPVRIGIRVRDHWTRDGVEFEWDDATAKAMIESIR